MSENRSETAVRNYDRGFADGQKTLHGKKVFYIDEVRKLLHQLDREEISLSKFVEVLNEKVTGLPAIELYKMDLQKHCKHEGMVDTGTGFVHCAACGWSELNSK